MGDGGKWVCGMSRYEKNSRPCILYSFGVQNESSFEQEMLQRTNCEIWGYDYSVRSFGPAITNEHAHRTHFLKAGIAGKTDKAKTPPFYSIQDLMQMNGHNYIDILKIDVEFAEFAAMTPPYSYSIADASLSHRPDAHGNPSVRERSQETRTAYVGPVSALVGVDGGEGRETDVDGTESLGCYDWFEG